MSIAKRVSENMKLLRSVRGLSRRGLAEQLLEHGWIGCNRDIVTNIELGRRSYISVDEAAVIAEVFGVHFYDLVGIDPPSADHHNVVQDLRSANDRLAEGGAR